MSVTTKVSEISIKSGASVGVNGAFSIAKIIDAGADSFVASSVSVAFTLCVLIDNGTVGVHIHSPLPLTIIGFHSTQLIFTLSIVKSTTVPASPVPTIDGIVFPVADQFTGEIIVGAIGITVSIVRTTGTEPLSFA